MEINKDEIKETKKIGKLNGSDVKMITLKGGFHIGMGKKEKDSKKNDILAVGSHPALVSHQISKKYNSKFEENLAKNESETMPSVVELSDILNIQIARRNKKIKEQNSMKLIDLIFKLQ